MEHTEREIAGNSFWAKYYKSDRLFNILVFTCTTFLFVTLLFMADKIPAAIHWDRSLLKIAWLYFMLSLSLIAISRMAIAIDNSYRKNNQIRSAKIVNFIARLSMYVAFILYLSGFVQFFIFLINNL